MSGIFSPLDVGLFTGVLLHLPTRADLPFIPRAQESHHLFGAGFIFIGSMMSMETLAGKVWHRHLAWRLLFPAILIFLGWGMVLVAFIEPLARVVHLTMGLPMMAGGWAEARYRMGLLERRYTDVFIVPALVLAAVDTAFFHLNGPPGNPIIVTHLGLVILALVVAGLRVYQSANLQSMQRSMFISLAVTAIGVDLWIDAFFQ